MVNSHSQSFYRYGFYRLPEVANDPTSITRFILSADGITLLGDQQVAEEIVEKVLRRESRATGVGKGKINFM